jgi:hypothetical protein
VLYDSNQQPQPMVPALLFRAVPRDDQIKHLRDRAPLGLLRTAGAAHRGDHVGERRGPAGFDNGERTLPRVR